MKDVRNYDYEESILDIYRRVLLGEQILKQQIKEVIAKGNTITEKVKNIYYSMEEAAQGVRKMQGLDTDKQDISIQGALPELLVSGRKRKAKVVQT